MLDPAIVELTASDAVQRIARGDLRAEDYAQCLLGRYRARKSLNTVTWIDETRVLEQARGIDVMRSRGGQLGPLAGLPVIIKDNIDVAGTPSAAANASLASNMRSTDAPVVASLLRSGAVFFAKANMHELAGGGTCSNPTSGFVGNPWDPLRIPGGSSGGTAAAIAARIVPAGLGSDTAGSVRIPAALCGIAGLRPTIYGGKLYSDAGVVPLARDLDTIGPMARTVADVALLHAAITGTARPGSAALSGVRIGIAQQPYWEQIDSPVALVVDRALERLRQAGVIFVDVDISAYYPDASEVYRTLVMHGIKEDLAGYLAQAGSRVSGREVVAGIASQDTKALFELAANTHFSVEQIAAARTTQRDAIVATYREMFRSQGLSAVAFPTEPVTAAPINTGGDHFDDEIEINGQKVNANSTLIRNTHVTGALGVPGLNVPAGLSAQGLPVGLELDGLAGQDTALLALGMAVEATLGTLPPPPPQL